MSLLLYKLMKHLKKQIELFLLDLQFKINLIKFKNLYKKENLRFWFMILEKNQKIINYFLVIKNTVK